MELKRRLALLMAMAMIVTSLVTGGSSTIVYGAVDQDDQVTVDEVLSDAGEGIAAEEAVIDDTAIVDDSSVSLEDEDVITIEKADPNGQVIDENTEDADILQTEDGSELEANGADWETVGMQLNANGGTFPNGKETYELTYTTAYLSGTSYIPTKADYMFTGWYAEAGCKTLLSKANKDNDRYELKAAPEVGTTLYAGWTKDFYTVTYDFKGGYTEYYNEANRKYEKLTQRSYQVPFGAKLSGYMYYPSDVRNDDLHYSFRGFAETDGGTDVISRYSYELKGNVTLYAVWNKDKYVVTYDANGGYYEEYDRYEQKYIKKDTYLRAYEPSEDGTYLNANPQNDNPKMALVSWYLDKECKNEPVWKDGIPGKLVLTKDITLFAKWESTNKVISFDPNGGYFYDEENKTKDKNPKGFGTQGVYSSDEDAEYFDVIIPKNDDLHKKFIGWCSDKAGTNVVFDVKNNSYSMSVKTQVKQDVTYYAGWADAYKVATFNAGDGKFRYYDENTGEGLVSSNAVFRANSEGRLSHYPENLECNDGKKIFDGWYVGDVKVQDIRDYKVTQDTTFTARYSAYYTITADSCGGYVYRYDNEGKSKKVTTPQIVRVPKGKNMTYSPDALDTPRIDDTKKTHGGWYFDRAYTKPVGELSQYVPDGDKTIYFRWLNRYTVSFNALEGNFKSGSKRVNYIVTEGNKFGNGAGGAAVFEDPTAPQGKAFVGWYKDAALTKPVDRAEILNTVVNGNIAYYAKYDTAYTVTFDVNGGQFVSKSISTNSVYKVQIAKGESIKGKVPTVVTTENKVFRGWFTDKECTKEVSDLYNYPINSDVTLYAGFTECYLLTFKTNKAGAKFENGTDTVVVKVVKGTAYRYSDSKSIADQLYQAPEITVVPEGAIALKGWSGKADGSGRRYFFNSSGHYYYEEKDGGRTYTYCGKYGFIPTEDMTFYTSWAKEIVNITFHANGGKFYNSTSYAGKMGKDDTEWIVPVAKGIVFGDVDKPYNLSLEGHYTSGWYKEPENKNLISSSTVVNKAMDVYVKWVKYSSGGGDEQEKFSITYHAGEGYFYSSQTDKVRKDNYSSFSSTTWYSAYLPKINDDSKVFLTWCTDEACTKPIADDNIYFSGSYCYIRLNEKVTDLYAKYGTAYTVTIKANGGYFDDSSSRTKDPSEIMRNTTVLYAKTMPGGAIIISDYTNRIRRDGNKIFGGWYLDAAFKNKAVTYTEDSGSYEYYKPKGSEVLYARWIDYKKPTSIKINEKDKSIKVGDTIKLTASILPQGTGDDQDIHWWIGSTSRESSDNRMYPVVLKSDGTVVGQTAGTATVYAEINGIRSATIKITVTDDNLKPSLTLSATKLTLKPGDSSTLRATVVPSSKASSITWSTSAKTIATIEGSGTAVTVKAGTKEGKATITAKVGDLTATCTVTVKDPSSPDKPGKVVIKCLNKRPEYMERPLTLADLFKADKKLNYTSVTLYDSDNEKALSADQYDYTMTNEGKKGEKFKLVFTLKNGYSGTLDASIKIKAYSFTKDNAKKLSIDCSSVTYSRAGSIPKVTVKFGDTTLTEGTDYTLAFSNNTQAAAATDKKAPTVTVKGKGNFTGSAKKTFTIEKGKITDLVLEVKDKELKENGKAGWFKSNVKVTEGGKSVRKGKDINKFKKTDVKYYYAGTQNEIPNDAEIKENTEIEARLSVTCPASSPYGEGTVDLVGRYRIVAKGKLIKSGVKVTPVDKQSLRTKYEGGSTEVKPEDFKVTVKKADMSAANYKIEFVQYDRSAHKLTVKVSFVGEYGGAKAVKIKL